LSTPSGVTNWLALWTVTRDLGRVARRDIDSAGLCLSDFAVLEVLLHRGPLRVKAIAERVLLTSGSMTSAVDRLERRELVRRTAHPSDARVRLVELTDAGRALIEPAFAAHAATMEGVFEALTPEERATLLSSLLKLRRAIRNPKENR